VGYEYASVNFYKHDNQFKEHIQFKHNFIKNNKIIKPKYFELVKPIIAQLQIETGKKIKSISRMKSNLLMYQKGIKEQYPHVDGFDVTGNGLHDCFGKKTLLYYVNDSDGDTTLYNEYYTGEYINELTVQQKVSPKMGRAVLFDSNQLHAGSGPENSDYRIVINTVFEFEE